MVDHQDVRRLALGLAGTSEAPHFDRVAFKAKRTYATLAADGRTANLKFTPDEQVFKCMMAPEVFAPISNTWGQRGWTAIDLSALTLEELETALTTAWRGAVVTRHPG